MNILFVGTHEQMPGYVKFMEDLVTEKRTVNFKLDNNLNHHSCIASYSLM